MSSDAFEGVGIGLWIVDAQGRTEYANHALQTLLGTRQVVGQRALDFFAADEQDAVEERLAQLAFGAAQEFDAHIETDTGSQVAVHLRASPRFDGSGGLLGSVSEVQWVGGASDTAHPAAQGRAYLASYLTAGVVHTLNTYLQAIVGYSDLLEDDERLPEVLSQPVERLRHSAGAASRLVANLISLAEVDDDPSPGPVDLVPLVEEGIATRDAYLLANHIRVHRDYPDNGVYVRGTLPSLRRAVSHLVGNACQILLGHRASSGRLRLAITATEEEVTLRMLSEGAAYPDDLLTPQMPESPSPMRVGHEMALDCFSASEGRVTISNVERGGIVEVVLPRDDEEVGAGRSFAGALVRRESSAAKDSGASDRVLVVDDEEFILDLSRRALKGRCALTTARSGDEALALLKGQEFELVITDLRMPGTTDGIGLYEWARANRPKLARHMVFTTADTVNAQSREFLMLAGRPFITKPYKMQQYRAFILDELRRVGDR